MALSMSMMKTTGRVLARSRAGKAVFASAAPSSSMVSIPPQHGGSEEGKEDWGKGRRKKKPFLIGVAGGTASGKTCLCREIVQCLKTSADSPSSGVSFSGKIVNISQDCFYRNLSQEERESIGDHNFDHPSAFDLDVTINAIELLKEGRDVEIPVYDYKTSSRLVETTLVSDAEVILVDGILLFYWKELRDLFDLKIFVDTDADTRLARRIRRDIVERGRDIGRVLDQYESTVKPSFDSYVFPTKRYADVIVPRGAENKPAIHLLAQHIRQECCASSYF